MPPLLPVDKQIMSDYLKFQDHVIIPRKKIYLLGILKISTLQS